MERVGFGPDERTLKPSDGIDGSASEVVRYELTKLSLSRAVRGHLRLEFTQTLEDWECLGYMGSSFLGHFPT